MTYRELVFNDGRILYRYLGASIFGILAIVLLAFSGSDKVLLYIGSGMLVAGFLMFISGNSILKVTRYLEANGKSGKAKINMIYTERASYMIEYKYQVDGVNYIKSEPSFFADRYKEGDEADILFDPKKPKRAILKEKVSKITNDIREK